MPNRYRIASDNYAGVHPQVLAAMVAANTGHAPAYGSDSLTSHLQEVIKGHFGPSAHAYPMLTGTGANVVALTVAMPRWGAVIAAETAHINTDENAAPERMTGIKIVTAPTPDGKLTPAHISELVQGVGDQHFAQAAVVSISQPTELGTVYSLAELAQLKQAACSAGLLLHVDGARLSNAAAHLGVTLGQAAGEADIISLGATKNGAMGAEAIVTRTDFEGVAYVRKFCGQLSSKMRFVSAQLIALFEDDLWLQNATQANAMATRLAVGARTAGIDITQMVQANAVFPRLQSRQAEQLQEQFGFYDWSPGVYRWMCAWDTPAQFIDEIVAAL